MEIRNVNDLLGNLVKDENSDISVLRLTEGVLSLYLARLTAGRKLPAHFHNHGNEIYQILAGNGTFEMGELTADGVQWSLNRMVKSGDIFEVPAGAVHRLTGGMEDLKLIFFTAPSHLGEDRVFLP